MNNIRTMGADNMSLQTIFHGAVFLAYVVTSWYDSYVETGRATGFAGKLCYLTIWNMILQTLYYGLCFANGLLTLIGSKGKRLQRWRDNMHASVAFPVGTFVVVSFWTIYAIDRELVFPKILDEIIPSWLNHMLHTAVLPFLLIDKAITHHKYPKRHLGIFGACGLAMVYIAWILFIAYYDNFWVYPILAVLNMYQRAGFIAVCWVVFGALYILGESLTSFIWTKEVQPKHVSSKKHSKAKRH